MRPILWHPEVVITPVIGLAEGDLAVSINLNDSPSTKRFITDVQRVRDGKIVEHWDVVSVR